MTLSSNLRKVLAIMTQLPLASWFCTTKDRISDACHAVGLSEEETAAAIKEAYSLDIVVS